MESFELRGTIVVVQHATDPLASTKRSVSSGPREWLNQLVPDALMVTLDVVVRHELGYRATKMPLPQQDHAIEALLFDRPHEPLRIRVAVRSSERRANDPDARLFEEFQYVIALHSRRVHVAGPTQYPGEGFVVQAMRDLQ